MTTKSSVYVAVGFCLLALAGIFFFSRQGKNGGGLSLGGEAVATDTAGSQLFKNDAPVVDLGSPHTVETGTTTYSYTDDYTNDVFHFMLKHPTGSKVTEYDEGDGAKSYAFENEDLSLGFQIFVTPYSEKEITKARFLEDQPSGSLATPVSVTVDGASGMMFYGKNDDIGDTKEVWFVKNGLLYEVYTYKSLEPLLLGVLQTWKFK